MVGKDAQDRDIVEMWTFNGASSPSRCEGSVRPSTAACSSAKVSIGASAEWIVVPVEGRVDGAFYLVAVVR